MKRIFTAFLCLFAMVGMAQNIVFQETFNGNHYQGGNDGVFNKSNTSLKNTKKDNIEVKLTQGYGAKQCVKMGGGNSKGIFQSSSIMLSGNGVLTFRAAVWGKTKKYDHNKIVVTAENATLLQEGAITLTEGQWNEITINISEAKSNVKITISAEIEQNNRFFLDDVVVKTAPANLNITIGSALYTTFFTDKAYTMPEGLTGNTVTVSGTTAMLTASYPAGSSVPANTPLLISGTQGDHNATILSGAVAPVSATNLLKGTLTAETKAAPEGGKVYIFAQDPEGLGFYWQNGTNGTTVHNAAGKCYLEVPAGGAGVQGFRLDDALTPIEAVATDKAEENVYDLSGRRVSNAGRGLYIVNGKKVIR